MERVEALKRGLAAIRIQRAYRAFRRRRRLQRALLASRPDAARLPASVVDDDRAATACGDPNGVIDAAALPGVGPSVGSGGAGPHPEGRLPSQEDRSRSAVVIQSWARGWLVRRSQALWWARSLAGLKGRRVVAAAWRRHRDGMMAQNLELESKVRRCATSSSSPGRRESGEEPEEEWVSGSPLGPGCHV